MKQILFLLLLFPTIAYSQYDSTRNRQTVYAYGFNWLNGKFASSFVIPTDTAKLAVRDSGAIAYKSGNLFKYNGFSWSIIEGTGGGGGTDYVNAGWGVEVDSAGRNYTVGVDSNAIKGLDLGSDTVLVEQPLYVDADTLKFNVDSSGLVKDVMRSSDSVYIKINGVWEFAFIDSVGSGGSGGGSVEYVTQGWGVKVDSVGRNYTVKADSAALATLYKVQQDSLAIVGNMWKLGGNTGINDSTKFLGTTDKKALNFRVNGRRSGFIDSTSTNTIFGYGALQNVTSGLTNTVVGYEALKANTTGGANTAIGYRALYSNTTSAGNFAAGREALRSNTTGGNNFGMGFFALYSNVSGSYNIGIGNSALQNNTTNNNLAIGNNAALNNTIGSVVAIGNEALKANTTGLNNTAIGLISLWSNTTSSNNTAIGAQALYYSTGQGNTAVGSKGLFQNSTGTFNTVIGVNSLYGNTTTYGNTAIGNSALYSNGNTVTGLGAITGGSGYTNGTYTNVTMTTIPNDVFASEYPVANITVSGGTVTSVTLVSGGAGIGAATSLSATAAQIGGTGSGFSVLITSFNPGGNYSTAIGDSAAANQRRGNANIAVGPHVALPDTAAGKQLNIGNVIFGTGTYDGTSMSSTATSDSRVSIGTNTQPASAILTLSSTNKGFLPPRMTGSQAEAIASPAEGLIIYSTDGSGSTITSKGWWGYDGSTWTKFN